MQILQNMSGSASTLVFKCSLCESVFTAGWGEYTLEQQDGTASDTLILDDGTECPVSVFFGKHAACNCPVCGYPVKPGYTYDSPAESYNADEDEDPGDSTREIYVDDEEPETILAAFTVNAGTTSKTYEDARITERHTVKEYLISDDTARGSEWAVQTGDGTLTISGTISKDAWVSFLLEGPKAEDVDEDADAPDPVPIVTPSVALPYMYSPFYTVPDGVNVQHAVKFKANAVRLMLYFGYERQLDATQPVIIQTYKNALLPPAYQENPFIDSSSFDGEEQTWTINGLSPNADVFVLFTYTGKRPDYKDIDQISDIEPKPDDGLPMLPNVTPDDRDDSI